MYVCVCVLIVNTFAIVPLKLAFYCYQSAVSIDCVCQCVSPCHRNVAVDAAKLYDLLS